MAIGEAEVQVLPGVIDLHTHMRDLGASHKETFETATEAALAGGVVLAADMPNNVIEHPELGVRPYLINSWQRQMYKHERAAGRLHCDVVMNVGYDPDQPDPDALRYMAPYAGMLKFMMDISQGNTKEREVADFLPAVEVWRRTAGPQQRIAIHAEARIIEEALAKIAGEARHPVHVAHVSNRAEMQAVIDAKNRGLDVTCGACPHHLTMDQRYVDQMGWRARMKPFLGEDTDVEFLWASIDAIDAFESDHAPHTLEEKDKSDRENPEGDPEHPVCCFGVPGLEAMLPLLISAVKAGRLTPTQLVERISKNPAKIIGVPVDTSSSVKVEMVDYEFGTEHIRSKCGWSPYVGRMVTGKVIQVDLHGTTVYRNGEVVKPFRGRILTPWQEAA